MAKRVTTATNTDEEIVETQVTKVAKVANEQMVLESGVVIELVPMSDLVTQPLVVELLKSGIMSRDGQVLDNDNLEALTDTAEVAFMVTDTVLMDGIKMVSDLPESKSWFRRAMRRPLKRKKLAELNVHSEDDVFADEETAKEVYLLIADVITSQEIATITSKALNTVTDG